MNTKSTLPRFGVIAFLLFLFSAATLQAQGPISADSKILIIGPAADIHETALEGLIAGDSTASALNVSVDSFPTDNLLYSYHQGGNFFGLRNNPSDSNALLDTLDGNYDLILIHPSERHIRIGPELHMEGVRLLERHVREQGPRIMLLVPTYDPAYALNYKNPSTAEQIKERVYRIKDALELEAIPAGITWEAVLADDGITATATTVSTPNAHAVNVYATTLFSALFERSPASSTYRHGGISDTEFGLISDHAFLTWQTALTATHYTGEYVGIFSPIATAYDPLAKRTGWSGRSTESISSDMFEKIYRRKGIDVMQAKDKASSADLGLDFDFYLTRGNHSDSTINYYRKRDPGNDLRVIGMMYKNNVNRMRAYALSTTGNFRDWYLTSRSFDTQPYNKRYAPNFLAYTRHWLEDNFSLSRYGDSHWNDDATMIQSSLIYTIMSGGEHPLSGDINLHAWTGRQRYAATLGYAMVMGIGRLKKLEMPPVAKGFLRYEMLPDTANPLTLEGIDYNGLPLTAEIDTPPEHGTLTHLGGTGFTYTPDPGFNGIDFVTYRVNNGEESSLPLTIALPVAPYTPSPPQGTVFFEEDFEDQTFEGWDTAGSVFIVTNTENQNTNWTNGFKRPFDGTAALSINNAGSAERAVDTLGFENLHLTIRVGSGTRGFNSNKAPDEEEGVPAQISAEVEWFDGTTWHTLISHGDRYQTNRLLDTYEFALPAAASNNPAFALRLKRVNREAHFDSIRLSGDVVPFAPVAVDQSLQVAQDVPVDITLEASDLNIFDTLTYSYSQPSHGTVSGTAPDVVYTPDPDYIGPDSFTFTANDGSADSNTATVTMNVRNNTPPAADAGSDQVVTLTQYTPSPVTGADIRLDAAADDGLNATWEDSTGSWNLSLDAGVSFLADAGSALQGITATYVFPGGTSGAGGGEGTTFKDMGWNGDPVTLEVWFRPDSVSDDGQSNGQVLFETGGSTGLGIFYNDGTIGIGHDTSEVISSVDVSSLTDEFIQVVLTYDMTGTDDFVLYVNGVQVATGNRSDNDWSGSDDAGLGARGGNNTGGRGNSDSGTESFEGRIAMFRAYRNQVLTPEEVQMNFESVAQGQRASLNLSPTVSDGESDPLVYLWSQVSGPGSVEFDDESAAAPSILLPEAGTYVLRLTVDDGLEQAYDEVTVSVSQPITDSNSNGIDDDWETDNMGGLLGENDTHHENGVAYYFLYLSGWTSGAPTEDAGRLQMGTPSGAAAPLVDWEFSQGVLPGVHFEIWYSTDLETWHEAVEDTDYTLETYEGSRPDTTRYELRISETLGDKAFIRLQRP